MTNAVKKTASKYTEAMVARMNAEAPLNKDKAAALAAEFGKDFSARSVIAKANRDGIAYEVVKPTTKSGDPIEKKETLVAEIAALVGTTLEGLEKAPKPALVALRNYLAA